MAWSQSSKLTRFKYYLRVLFKMFVIKCYFCDEVLDGDEFYPKKSDRKNGHQIDPFMVHHKDGHHHNDKPENWAFAHRACHSRYNWMIRHGEIKEGVKPDPKKFKEGLDA